MATTHLPIKPHSKPRQTQADKWKKRPVVVRYREFKDALKGLLEAHPHLKDFPEASSVCFTMPMPASWSKKKRAAMLGTPHKQRPDIDNLEKGLLDALLTEDCHIWRLWSDKVWGIEGCISITPHTDDINLTRGGGIPSSPCRFPE